MSVFLAACDICGGRSFKPLYPGTIHDYDHDPARYYASSRQEAGYLPIVQCQNCGLVMTNPRDDAQTLARVYAALQDPVYDSERKNRSVVARQRVELIRRLTGANHLPLLDVGCATGIFAGTARAAGWQATGIEPSSWSIQEARKAFPDVTFINNSVEETSFPDGSFNVITFWDVLEHVASPSQTLRAVTPWLAENGWLLINVPNVDSLPARIMGKRWVLLLREHLWYFSPKTIRQILEPVGYQIVDIQQNLVTFSLANILRRLSQYFPKRQASPSNQPHPFLDLLNAVAVRFPMGEMIVTARKTKSST